MIISLLFVLWQMAERHQSQTWLYKELYKEVNF